MAWGIGDIFKAMKGSGKGYESDVDTSPSYPPARSVKDTDYGRQLRGDRSPEYSDALEGRFTNREERNLARRFDPSNKEEVLQMQRDLNKMGYTDEEGNPLAEDAIFGAKTERALRSFQGVPYEEEGEEESAYLEPGGEPTEEPSGSEFGGFEKGGAPGSWAQWLFEGKDPWEFRSPQSRRQLGNAAQDSSGREDYPEDFGGDQGPY